MLFLFLSFPKPAPAVSKQGGIVGPACGRHPEVFKNTGFSMRVYARVAPTRPKERGNDGSMLELMDKLLINEGKKCTPGKMFRSVSPGYEKYQQYNLLINNGFAHSINNI